MRTLKVRDAEASSEEHRGYIQRKNANIHTRTALTDVDALFYI